MKQSLLIALFWCVIGQPVYAGQDNPWWKFSGKTETSDDGLDGRIGLAADRLLGKNDAIGFDYRDAHSYKQDTGSTSASFRYHLPAGANRVRVAASRSRFDYALSSGGRRFDAHGESRVLGLGASRRLFSGFGLSFDGIARHKGRDRESFEKGRLVSESSYDLSSLGLEASGSRELWAGSFLSTRILALSGREFESTEYPLGNDVADESAFYKVAASMSLEQDLFQWHWRANARYQFADEDLPSSEYLTVASPSLLTGFNGQSVAVIRGGWLRLDTASPVWQMPFLDDVLSTLNFAVLQGWIPSYRGQADRHGVASAGQVSLKMRGHAFTADLSVGRMIRSSTLAMTVPDHPDVRFSLSMGI